MGVRGARHAYRTEVLGQLGADGVDVPSLVTFVRIAPGSRARSSSVCMAAHPRRRPMSPAFTALFCARLDPRHRDGGRRVAARRPSLLGQSLRQLHGRLRSPDVEPEASWRRRSRVISAATGSCGEPVCGCRARGLCPCRASTRRRADRSHAVATAESLTRHGWSGCARRVRGVRSRASRDAPSSRCGRRRPITRVQLLPGERRFRAMLTR